MKHVLMALGLVVALAPSATLKGRPANGIGPATLKGGPTSVTVTLVRWPFT